ncbi:DUF4255 domain-containing protein, partial [Streptomyces sp. SID685]|nr:DUF4255 domain-containing protein [Streptomyces sp. SID685]
GVRVRAPLAAVARPAAPPVTEGLLVRTGGLGPEEEPAPGRRLRYEEVGDPGSQGFAGPRARPAVPARRRRGRQA